MGQDSYEFTKNMRAVRWYVVVNDAIGGWDISNVPIPVSQANPNKGEFSIAQVMTEDLAEDIVECHNIHLGMEDDSEPRDK